MVAGGKKNRAKNLSLSLRNKKKIKIKFAVALEKNLHTGQPGLDGHEEASREEMAATLGVLE